MSFRLFFFLLVFANLIFFAWTQGYFGQVDENREPQRLSSQLQADKLRVVGKAQAPAAKKPDMACRIINGLNAAEAEALKAAMKTGGAGEGMTVSHETIYRSLFIQARGALKRELLSALRSRKLMRRAHGDFFRGRLSLGDPQAAEPVAGRYDAMWDESTPCLPANTLGL